MCNTSLNRHRSQLTKLKHLKSLCNDSIFPIHSSTYLPISDKTILKLPSPSFNDFTQIMQVMVRTYRDEIRATIVIVPWCPIRRNAVFVSEFIRHNLSWLDYWLNSIETSQCVSTTSQRQIYAFSPKKAYPLLQIRLSYNLLSGFTSLRSASYSLRSEVWQTVRSWRRVPWLLQGKSSTRSCSVLRP